MNTTQVSDSQINAIYFCCLAMLNSDLSTEEKVRALEEALIANILLSNQPLTAIQSGLEMFDSAIISYSGKFAERLRSGEAGKISTSSKVLDAAFSKRIESLLSSSFSE